MVKQLLEKDVERASDILQGQFAIVHGPTRFWNQEICWYIMTATTMLNNMIIENECDQGRIAPSNS
jgi:hypothetical protein